MVCCSLLAANKFGKQQLAEVCYPPCGCFTNDPPHNGRPLPESPEQQALSWRLYTRQNPNIGTDINLYNTVVPLVLLFGCVLEASVTRLHIECFLQRMLAAEWFRCDDVLTSCTYSPDFVATKKTKFLIHGWQSSPGLYATMLSIKDAFLEVR